MQATFGIVVLQELLVMKLNVFNGDVSILSIRNYRTLMLLLCLVCNLLSVRRENAVIKLFNEIKNPAHVLHYLLPIKPRRSGSVTRDKYPFELKFGKTSRRAHSLIYYCIGKRV